MAATTRVAGLAKQIRSATDSEQVDIAGYDHQQVIDLVAAAFTEPIKTKKMLRFSFLVGGGKKVRQKYRPELPGELRDALLAIGYSDDRTASCVVECAGSFKYQHDTDKDIKTIFVFPRVEIESSVPGDDGDDAAASGVGGFANDSPEYKCTVATLDTFYKMVTKKCGTFSQMRRLLEVLKGVAERIEEFDARLASGEVLDPAEQELYSEAEAVPEKVAWVRTELERFIDEGCLTEREQRLVVNELAEKLSMVEEALSQARSDGSLKKAARLEAQLKLVAQKQATVEAVTPIVRPKGKHAAEIKEIKKQLKALDKIEAAKGLQDIATIKKLNERPKLEEQLRELVLADTGWFETYEGGEAEEEKKKKKKTPADGSFQPAQKTAKAGGKAKNNPAGPNAFSALGEADG